MIYIDKLVMSCEVFKDAFLFFKKSKILIISDNNLYWLDKKKKYLKRKDSFEEIVGLTKSLILDQFNFIIHISNRADEELYCE